MTLIEEWKSNRVYIGISNLREVLYLAGFDNDALASEPLFRLVVFTDHTHPFIAPAEGILSPDIQVIQCSIQDDAVLQDFFSAKCNLVAKARLALFCAERYVLAFDSYSEVAEQFGGCNISKASKILENLNKYELREQPQRFCHFVLNEKELLIYSRLNDRTTSYTIPVRTSPSHMKRWMQIHSEASHSFKEYMKELTVFDLPLNPAYTVEKVKDSPVYQITHKLDPEISIMFLSAELTYLFESLKEYAQSELMKAFATLGQ